VHGDCQTNLVMPDRFRVFRNRHIEQWFCNRRSP
jgi:hypothetical protein